MVLNAVKNAVMLDFDDTKAGKVCVFDPLQTSVKRENIKCMCMHDDQGAILKHSRHH